MILHPIDFLRVYPIFPLGDFPQYHREEYKPKEKPKLITEVTPFELVLKQLENESYN